MSLTIFVGLILIRVTPKERSEFSGILHLNKVSLNQYIHSLSNVRIITKFYSSIIGWRKLKVGWNTSINNIPLAGYTCRWRNKQHQWRYWFLHRRKIFIHEIWFQYFSISWTLYISLSINSCLKIYFIT